MTDSGITADTVAADIEAIALAVPGVRVLYPVGTAGHLASTGARLLGQDEPTRVRPASGGVEIAIGVDGSHAAPAVLRAVGAAVAPLLGAGAEVRVTVVRIER